MGLNVTGLSVQVTDSGWNWALTGLGIVEYKEIRPMKTLILLLALSMSSASLADVPNTFVPNTPARASEVNENFSALAQRINTLEDASQVPGSGSVPLETYTYQKRDRPVGSVVYVFDIPYEIVSFDVVSFADHSVYAVKVPLPLSDVFQIRLRLDTQEVRGWWGAHDRQTAHLSIDGHPLAVYVTVENDYMSDDVSEFRIETTISVYSTIYIDDSTTFHLQSDYYPNSLVFESPVYGPVAPGDRDFAGAIDVQNELLRKPAREVYVQQVLELFNYVVITPK